MGRSPIDEAFPHHVWATQRLIDRCIELSPEQLEAAVPGTYGSILETMRHLVGADTYYLAHLTGDPAREIDSDGLGLLTNLHRLMPHARIILMTAHGSPELAENAIGLGACCVLNKPFEMSALAEIIHPTTSEHQA